MRGATSASRWPGFRLGDRWVTFAVLATNTTFLQQAARA
jgi:hypothetical protein